VASAQYFDYYPPSVVKLPDVDQPPQGMPPVAWSKYGELLGYQDQPKNATGDPGTDLPDTDVLSLRRAYYASVTQTDDMLGKVCVLLLHSLLAVQSINSTLSLSPPLRSWPLSLQSINSTLSLSPPLRSWPLSINSTLSLSAPQVMAALY
jgi:hypothetical protein